MEKFEFLPHTADLKFRAYGRSFEEALMNATRALSHAFVGEQEIGSKITKSVSVSAESLEGLVHDFLSEFIFFFETEHYVAVDVSVSRKGKYNLTAKVKGGVLDFSKHHIETEVKAVTYHDMKVSEEEGRWIIQVVCDI